MKKELWFISQICATVLFSHVWGFICIFKQLFVSLFKSNRTKSTGSHQFRNSGLKIHTKLACENKPKFMAHWKLVALLEVHMIWGRREPGSFNGKRNFPRLFCFSMWNFGYKWKKHSGFGSYWKSDQDKLKCLWNISWKCVLKVRTLQSLLANVPNGAAHSHLVLLCW